MPPTSPHAYTLPELSTAILLDFPLSVVSLALQRISTCAFKEEVNKRRENTKSIIIFIGGFIIFFGWMNIPVVV